MKFRFTYKKMFPDEFLPFCLHSIPTFYYFIFTEAHRMAAAAAAPRVTKLHGGMQDMNREGE
jgi:hypothetical protein